MIAPLFFLAISCLSFYPVLSSRMIFCERDLSSFFIPPRYLWVQMVRGLELPLWNPFNYSGIPLLATLQPGVFYPPHVFYLFFPFQVTWNWLIILHFAFSGFSVYLFLRYLRCSREASYLGGIIFMLSGYLLSVHNLLPHLFSVSWFPLILLFFVKYFDTRNIRHLVAASVFLVMQFLAGAPEIVIMTVLTLVVTAAFIDVFTEKGSGGIPFFSRVKAILLILFLFCMLSAVQFLPFYELKALSIRRSGLTYQEASVWSMAFKDFIQFFLPDFFGSFVNDQKYWTNQSWLKTIYLGIMPFILSLFFFFSKDRRRWLFLLLIGISLLFALGGNTPVYRLLYMLPPFNSVRFPVKFLFLMFFIVSVTSAIGFDCFLSGVERKDRRVGAITRVVFYCGFVFALGWGCMMFFQGDVRDFFGRTGIKPEMYNTVDFNIHNIKRFLFIASVSCIALLVYMEARWRKPVLFFIICMVTLDLFLANIGMYRRASWSFYMAPHPFAERIAKAGDTSRYLVTPVTLREFKNFPIDRMIFNSNYAALFGTYSANGAEVLRVTYQDRLLETLMNTHLLGDAKRFLYIMGVRFIITSERLTDGDFALLEQIKVGGRDVYLYEYKKYPGRFLFYEKAIYARDDQEMMGMLLDTGIDLRKELIILNDGGKGGQASKGAGEQPGGEKPAMSNEYRAKSKIYEKSTGTGGLISLVSYKPTKVVLRCEAPVGGYVYVSDTWYPGWKATIDGKKTHIYRADMANRAVYVPGGVHTVVFCYRPIIFYVGLFVTCCGIIFAGFLVTHRRRHGKKD